MRPLSHMAVPEPPTIFGILITFTGVAIFAGALFATAGWYFTNRTQQVLDRRRHTYAVFISYKDTVLSNIEQVRPFLRKKNFPKFGTIPITEEMKIIEGLLARIIHGTP